MKAAHLASYQAVAKAIEGPTYFLGQDIPPIVVVLSYDTGGYVDMNMATDVRLVIARLGSSRNLANVPGSTSNVNLSRGEYRFDLPPDLFPSPGRYIAQVAYRISGRDQLTQPFIITVLEPVPQT
jgi:hypothetical protein